MDFGSIRYRVTEKTGGGARFYDEYDKYSVHFYYSDNWNLNISLGLDKKMCNAIKKFIII